MLTFNSGKGARFCDGLCRRDFLQVGGLAAGAVGLSLADLQQVRAADGGEVNCIVLFLVGGPSQLETWDPKPNAPDNVRGPFRPIQTKIPGIQIGEYFPLMARQAERFAIVRSVNHQSAPIHETGHQLMQTGRLFGVNREYPHYGAVVSQMRGARRSGVPPFVVLPGPIGNTGVSVSHGQDAGFLGEQHQPVFLHADRCASGLRVNRIGAANGVDPARLTNRRQLLEAVDNAQRAFDATGQSSQAFDILFAANGRRAYDLAAEPEDVRARYGSSTFGQSCLLARRLVEHGVRLVTVNMFDTVFGRITWDCHADGGALASSLHDYRQTLCPQFDQAYSALLDDLSQRGLLGNTLVVAMGEFGRTPLLNARGGRDHWPGVWSVLFAGAGVRGGQVIGSSDRIGSEPRDRPVSPAEVAASVYHALGIDTRTRLAGKDGRFVPLVDAELVRELFGA